MRKESRTKVGVAIAILAGLTGALVADLPADELPKADSKGVAIRPDGLAEPQAELEKRITSTPAGVMKASGLAGAMGGARVKVTSTEPQEIILPVPQLAGGQVPLSYFIAITPADAATEFRLRARDEGNVVVLVRLAGKKQDAQITWSSVVLLTPWDVTPNRTPAEPYRVATACVQAKSDEVAKLAAEIWPKSDKAEAFAASIQRHIRDMKRVERPRTLDALGILKSGENSICTANANLASALMRSKGIASRSIAVIPPTSQRLEMHRIVESAEKDRWIPFDPSSLQTEIPAKPWQNIIMAKTTTQDEQVAMKPRMGVALGCPYGQETELLTAGVMLTGQDFFWTIAKPLAEFEATEEAARLAAKAWTRYLETGALAPAQLKAGSAKTATELGDLLKSK
jgi:Transglutaminase-like superfamily